MNVDIRRLLLHLVVGFALFAGVDRFLLAGGGMTGLGAVGLVVATLATISISAAVARTQRFFYLVGGAAVITFVCLRLTVLFGGIGTDSTRAVTVALEAVLLVGLGWLARRLSYRLRLLEESLAVQMIPHFFSVVRRAEAAHDLAEHYLHLALRHGRTMSAVALEIDFESSRDGGDESLKVLAWSRHLLEFHALGRLAKMVAETVRHTDLTMRADGARQLLVLCPETPATGASQIVEKISERVAEELGHPVRFGVAVFPDEALNLHELVDCAQSRLGMHVTPTGAVSDGVFVRSS